MFPRQIIVAVLLAGAQAAQANAPATSAGSPEHVVVPWHGKSVIADVHEGHVIVDGDISVGTTADIRHKLATRPDEWVGAKSLGAGAIGINGYAVAYPSTLWPSPTPGSPANVPYVLSTPQYTQIGQTIADFNTQFSGVIQFVPQTVETDYVDFNLTGFNASGICFAQGVGRIGGVQTIGGSVTCTETALLHAMAHIVGLYHEHQRPDAGTFLTYTELNLDKPYAFGEFGAFDSIGGVGNFGAADANADMIGLYDLGSLMQYGRQAISPPTATGEFSKNGQNVLETIPAGIPIGEAMTYSAGDIDTIKRLYGAAPSTVIVTTLPAGLPIVVDGATLTSPQTFAWDLYTVHTISVPSTYLQRGSDTHSRYLFANWNDGQAITHTVKVMPGNRERTQPDDRPAITVYQAAFQHYVDLQLLTPSGGVFTVSPTPVAISGLPGIPWVLNQSILTLTANANAGNQFYQWTGQQVLDAGSNPRSFRITLGFFQIGADFVSQATTMYTVANSVSGPSPPISPKHPVLDGAVDGNTIYYARNFIAGDGWNSGQLSHQVQAIDTLYPFTGNVEYDFVSWSDGGADTHTLAALPASNTTYTVNYIARYRGFSMNDPPCATNSTPVAYDLYADGTVVPFSVTPLSGWSFAGWTDALTGQPNPTSLTVHDQFRVIARFNTTATPLAITGFTPANVDQGGPAQPLQIHGSGFTANTQVFVNTLSRAATFVDSTHLDITLAQSDLTDAGALDVQVFNSTASPACAIQRDATLPVLSLPNEIFGDGFE
ncbi:MAG TPA: M12 family metallopeptidase [Vicinamibacterales bacterium]|nr:M12 family metallopeptidase [Vicinamibacterales bacterium]